MAEQLLSFLIAGSLTTLLDFLIFNFFTRRAESSRIRANVISTSVAMLFSFVVNLNLVFHPAGMEVLPRAVKFVGITCFSSYFLQNVAIHLMNQIWSRSDAKVNFIQESIGRSISLERGFIEKNVSKAVAVLVGLMWNFLGYKFLVFGNYW